MYEIHQFVGNADIALEAAVFFELGQPALYHIENCSHLGKER